MYLIGKITNTHGIKGEVKVRNSSDFNRFLVSQKVFVVMKGEHIFFEIERVREQNHLFIVKFKGYDNINDVLMYKGQDLYTTDEKTKKLEQDEYHHQDLIGKSVYVDDGIYVGTVHHVIEVPQGHLLEIYTDESKKILIPFIKAFVGDINDDRIIIHPIEGLL
ncbi:MAG: 16S rRNA processing protein RimM [Acholeplasmataceae bacterium]|nr:16S rRNA processing protein RimM [Acholeplasmataceae bacterium]